MSRSVLRCKPFKHSQEHQVDGKALEGEVYKTIIGEDITRIGDVEHDTNLLKRYPYLTWLQKEKRAVLRLTMDIFKSSTKGI